VSYLTGGNGSFHTNHGLFQENPSVITPESISGRYDNEETAFLNLFGGGKPKQVDPNNPHGYIKNRTLLNNAIYSDQLGGNWDGPGTAQDYIEWYRLNKKDNPSIDGMSEEQQMAGTNPKLLELVGELSV